MGDPVGYGEGESRGEPSRPISASMKAIHDAGPDKGNAEAGEATGAAPVRRQALLVLGMHRSGTSSFAGLLCMLGAQAPATLEPANEWNEKGYWESRPLMSFHDRLLESAGSVWNDYSRFDARWFDRPAAFECAEELAALIDSEFDTASLFMVKDPRICRFFPFWRRVLDKLDIAQKILLPIRNPLEVAHSLHRRDGLPIDQGMLLWLRHCLDAEAATRDLPRSFVSYDLLLRDWRLVADRIAEDLGLVWPNRYSDVAGEVDEFISADRRHNVVARDALDLRIDVVDWVKVAYVALCDLVDTRGTDKTALARLDEVRCAFDRSFEISDGLILDHSAATKDLQDELNAIKVALDTDRQRDDEAAAALAKVHERLWTVERELNEALQRHAEEMDALQDERRRTNAMFEELVEESVRQSLSYEDQLRSVRRALAEARGDYDGIKSELSVQVGESQRLGEELAEARRAYTRRDVEVHQLWHALQYARTRPVRNLRHYLKWHFTGLILTFEPLVSARFAARMRRRREKRPLVPQYDAQTEASGVPAVPERQQESGSRPRPVPRPLSYWLLRGLTSQRWLLTDRAYRRFSASMLKRDRARSAEHMPRVEWAATEILDEAVLPVPRATAPLTLPPPVRMIAFYLPQFHPIPENDAWWGEGFTEWRNVTRATPLFPGHHQPRLPGDLGFYDLRIAENQRRQAELAKLYGLAGFCFYFYWFGGKRLLEQPTEQFLENKDIDREFCLCWANENWTRRWDGLESEILLQQAHSPEDDIAFISYLSKYLVDARYIRVDGKPLILVYRPGLMPEPRATVARWRQWCRENGIGDIFLAYVQSFERVDPETYAFDAAIEFPPNNMDAVSVTANIAEIAPGFAGKAYDWSDLAARSGNYSEPSYMLFRGVCPDWDNTARRGANATVLIGSTPERYREWVENAARETVARVADPSARLVFVNAWNEWAEGAYLEPDRRYGYAYLQATRDALECVAEEQQVKEAPRGRIAIVAHDAYPHGAQFLALNLARCFAKDFDLDVDLVLLGEGPLRQDFEHWATVHDLAGVDPRGPKARGVARALREKGHKAVICNTTVAGRFLSTLAEEDLRTIALIHELPDLIDRHGLGDAAARIAKQADRIVLPADLVADGFRRIAKMREDTVSIRPQGLYKRAQLRSEQDVARARVALRERFSLSPESRIVLAVGYADYRKGPDLFVDAAVEAIAKHSDLVFMWLGNAEESVMEPVRRRIDDAGLEERFVFAPLDVDTDLYYAGADLYALTSREDPFPSVVLEALDAGLPIVAFEETTGSGDLILKAGGRLVPAFDTSAFGTAILDLLSEAPAMSARSHRRDIIRRDFSFQSYAHDLLALAGLPPARISVIVPNYNYGHLLGDRLRSVLQQSHPVYELIVLDDASTDDSVERLAELIDDVPISTRVIRNDKNSGSVFRQWLRGVEAATGDFVWIAEADDLSDPEFLAETMLGFSDPSVVMSYCQSKQMGADGHILSEDYLDYVSDISPTRWRSSYVAEGLEELREGLAIKNTIPNVSGAVFRREALMKVLSAHIEEIAAFNIAGDWLTYVHLMEQGGIAFSNRSLNLHRRHQSGVTIGADLVRHLAEIIVVQRLVSTRHPGLARSKPAADAYAEKVYRQFGLDTSSSGIADHAALNEAVDALLAAVAQAETGPRNIKTSAFLTLTASGNFCD